jgi:FkbM family methyltransferase
MTWGHRLRVQAMERLPRAWRPSASFHYYSMRSLLEPELLIACRALKERSRAIDVGANEGVYTHAFARTGARVEAFEPQPESLEVLRAYARSRPQVHVHGYALGAAAGTAVLEVPRRDGKPLTGHARLLRPPAHKQEEALGRPESSFVVEVRTLDSFAFDDVAMIKIDVEGHELDVLRGAHETIKRNRPLILVEIEQRHMSVPMAGVFEELSAMDYVGKFLHPLAGLRPLREFVPGDHQDARKADTPRALYINNFFFAPAERPDLPRAQ